jgi:CheY-like chemotaxis protein
MKIRILLCDDASFIRDLIKRTLRNFFPQCEITEVSDGKKAQAFLSKNSVDLILSDWEMPGMSGEELLRWVRAEARLSDTPFVMVSSLGGKEHIVKAVQAGVSDYLGKPFSPDELIQKVHKTLAKAGKVSLPKMESSSRGGAFSSLEILSGKTDAVKEPPKPKGTALLQWQQLEFRCMIKALSTDEVTLVCKRGERHPGVFEDIALTLSPGHAAGLVMHGVRAYVHNCSAMEKRPDAEFIQMQLRFMLLDAEQQRQLSSIVADNP